MTMALGASAYPVAIFHLMTHAFFKAVLFLGAGSVIIAMHHEQDMRRMGGLKKYMPITYWTVLVGALANAGFPPFAGFFSKDTIIEALHASHTPGATFAYLAALAGVFFAGLYSLRLVFLTFHGTERMDAHTREHLHETPWVVTLPLVLLAIPSVVIGYLTIGPMLFGDFFKDAITILAEKHPGMEELAKEYHGPLAMAVHSLTGPIFWLALAGVVVAWFFYMKRPDIPAAIQRRFAWLYTILDNKYYFDWFNENVLAKATRAIGDGLWKGGDMAVIDGVFIDGSARTIGGISAVTRRLQSGYLYWYALVMIVGVIGLMTWQLFPFLKTLLTR